MIVQDARGLVTSSCVLEGEYGICGCSLGVPARIGKEGIHAIEEWRLDAWEQAHMDEAGRSVSELCRKAVS
jgi:malate dehydrogenase